MSLFSVTKLEMVQDGDSCVMSMSLFSVTKLEMVYFLIVNSRLRRAHNAAVPKGPAFSFLNYLPFSDPGSS